MSCKKWWEKGSIRTSKTLLSGFSLDQVRPEDIPEIFRKYASIGVNLTQVPVIRIKTGCGTDTDGFYFKSLTEPNNNPDLLSLYVEEGHKNNVRIVCYFNCHSFIPETKLKHPGWEQINEKGKPIYMYGTGLSACINNPEYRKWQAGVMKDMAQYDIDGIFLDGNCFRNGTCYCQVCKDLYRERFGTEIPLKSGKRNSEWTRFKEWQADCVTSYFRFMHDALKSVKPEAAFYINAGMRAPNWHNGKQNRRLMEFVDISLAEGGFQYHNLNIDNPIWKMECENKFGVTQSKGKPVIGAMALDHKRWNYYQLPASEIRLVMYSALAAGSNVSGAGCIMNNKDHILNVIKQVFDFTATNEKRLFPTVNKAKTAIVWSVNNSNYYAGSSIRTTDLQRGTEALSAGDLHIEFEGFYDSCFRKGIASDVIDEVSITDGNLSKYNVVILPNVACLSDKEMNALKQYVSNGGTLISSFETSLYNEFGEKRENFGLADLFGVRLDDENVEGPLLWDYVMPSQGDHYLSSMFKDYIFLPSPKFRLKTMPETAQKNLDCAEALKGCYDGFPPRTQNGFMYINNYGKGRSVYFSGTYGQAMMEWHFFEYFDILGKIYTEYAGQEIKLENAPESVSLNIRQNSDTGEFLVYLTNFTAAMTKPITKITGLSNVKLRTKLEIESMETLVNKDNFSCERIDNETVITIKYLDEFEIASIRFK